MDRIDTESEVHSSSIHDSLKTRTLYEMIRTWIGQPWDGVQYKRIAGELWDSIDDLNLMEGPYGVSVTLLESCIVDSAEGIDAGLFQAEQAVGNLKKLLENDDFGEGARIIEVYVNTNPVCRISNADRLLQQSQYREPLRWTRGMTVSSVASIVAILGFTIVMIGLQLWEPIRLLSLLFCFSMGGIWLYYVYKANSPISWRAHWILGHAGIFGMGMFILYVVLLWPIFGTVFPPPSDISSRFFSLLVMAIVIGSCMIIGGIRGDRLGKKQNYRPCL